jgi:hypothetical protein
MGTVSGVLHVVPSDFVKRVKYLPEEIEEDISEVKEVTRAWKRVEVDLTFLDVFVDWERQTFWMKVVNKSPRAIGGFAIAFDKNWAGLSPSCDPEFPSLIEFGDSCEVKIPMVLSEKGYRPADNSPLRVGLRVGSETKIFSVPIDGSAVLLDADQLTDSVLKDAWVLYTSEFQVEITGALQSDQVYMGRNIRVCNRSGNTVTVAFMLPPSRIFICKVQEIGHNLVILVHGESQLFDIIRASAESIFG